MKQPPNSRRDAARGQAILSLRYKVGLIQAELANYLGVSRRAVAAWEMGASAPNSNNLKQLTALAVERVAFRAGHET